MKVYLAGPMTGIPEFNYPQFAKHADDLRTRGFEVVSPHELCDQSMSWRLCMKVNIKRLVECDMIAMLPGWDKSRGACLEMQIAQGLGLEFMFLGGDDARS